MKKSAFVLLMALFVSTTGFAQTKNINMRAKSVTGKQVAIPKAGKNTNAVLSQTTMLVDGKIYPFLAFSFVSCVGDSLTGKVSVTVEATAKNESVMIDFGKNCGENLCLRAVDMKGNLFFYPSGLSRLPGHFLSVRCHTGALFSRKQRLLRFP